MTLKKAEMHPGPDLSERCIRCDQEFGDHSAKAPHGALYRNGLLVGPPCGGFIPLSAGQAKAEAARAKKIRAELLGVPPSKAETAAMSGSRLRDPWSALS